MSNASTSGPVPVQYDGGTSPEGAAAAAGMSVAQWALSRVSRLPSPELVGLTVYLYGGDDAMVALHRHSVDAVLRIGGDLGFGSGASSRSDFPDLPDHDGFTVLRWESITGSRRLSLIWHTDPDDADLALSEGLVSLPPAVAA